MAAFTRAQREHATNNPLLPSERRTSNTKMGAFTDSSRPTLFYHDDNDTPDFDDDIYRAKSSIVLSNVRNTSDDISGSDGSLRA